MQVCGWDVGGVNTKVALVRNGEVLGAHEHPFELQRAPDALVPLLRDLACRMGADAGALHAVTMTAELSQMFRTKREGVSFVIDALEDAFGPEGLHVFTVDGRFLPSDRARREPHAVAASNWAATAWEVARVHSDVLMVDVGTTTTDIIPIVNGGVAAIGRTDPERLASRELVYTGAVRTPAEAIVRRVPAGSRDVGVSAEGFASAGDAYLWRGELAPADYTVSTPDGRPATREFAGERLARLICADREMVDDEAVSAIADAIAGAQRACLVEAIERVRSRHPSLRTALIAGSGAFLAAAAAEAAGLRVEYLAGMVGDLPARCAPAASVALLLERRTGALASDASVVTGAGRAAHVRREASMTAGRSLAGLPAQESSIRETPRPAAIALADGPALVVKVGGSLLGFPAHLGRVVAALDARCGEPLLVVPGGGPFADAVREADRRHRPGDTASHWMAILAMDQFAHLLVHRLAHGALVTDAREAAAAVAAGRIPVLAPYQWLRARDPLPHAWEVTSDSIAAWVCRETGAPRLVLVKPPGITGPLSVDPHFSTMLIPGLAVSIVPADDERLEERLAVSESDVG